MKRYWAMVALLFLSLLTLFLLVEYLNPALFSTLGGWMHARNLAAVLLGIGLLTVDVLLPIPSSLIMMSNGALFGIGLGALLSVIGNLGAGVFGFMLGRGGGPFLARVVPLQDRMRANQLLEEWGWLAILVTRPLPLLAETTLIMAGASTMGWKTMLVATLAGSLPMTLLYAAAGAAAVNLENTVLAIALVLLVGGLFWFIGRRIHTGLMGRLKGEI